MMWTGARAGRVGSERSLEADDGDVSTATLLVIHGIDQGSRYEVGGDPVGVGRGVGNAIRVHDTEVSRQHALIRPEDGRHVLSDRRSSNGTFVNGRPILEHVLENGDRIQIGRSVMLYASTDPRALSQSASDRIDLVARRTEDHGSIVGQMAEEASRSIVPQAAGLDGERALAQTVANLQTLYRITEEAVTASLPLEQLLQHILDLCLSVIGADRGCLLVADHQTGELEPKVFSHREGIDVSGKMPVPRSILDHVLQTRQAVRTSDARSDRRFEPGQSIVQHRVREAICVPMQGRYELTGAIYVDTTSPPGLSTLGRAGGHKFDDEKLRLVAAVGRQAALAIENSRYQQAFVQAERLAAMGQTIAMLSHHIKNILQGVRGGSYLIDMGLRDHNEELVRKGWSIVDRNQGRIYHLVMDMLTFSKERQPALEPHDLNETVGEVVELVQTRADECGVSLAWKPGERLPVTLFDSEAIHRAVLNVVLNALDAVEGRDGAVVQISTGLEPRSGELYVAVADNGPGIPEEVVPHLFQAFESTKGARGTGLGLAVSRKIVREHGGEIVLENRIGAGCRFVLAWPRIDEEPHAEPQTVV